MPLSRCILERRGQFLPRSANAPYEMLSQYASTEINSPRNRWKRTAPRMCIDRGTCDSRYDSSASCRRRAWIARFQAETTFTQLNAAKERSGRPDRDRCSGMPISRRRYYYLHRALVISVVRVYTLNGRNIFVFLHVVPAWTVLRVLRYRDLSRFIFSSFFFCIFNGG